MTRFKYRNLPGPNARVVVPALSVVVRAGVLSHDARPRAKVREDRGHGVRRLGVLEQVGERAVEDYAVADRLDDVEVGDLAVVTLDALGESHWMNGTSQPESLLCSWAA